MGLNTVWELVVWGVEVGFDIRTFRRLRVTKKL